MQDNQKTSRGRLVKYSEGWNYLGSMLMLLENVGIWVKIFWHKKKGRLLLKQSNGQLIEVKMTSSPKTADEVIDLVASRLQDFNGREL